MLSLLHFRAALQVATRSYSLQSDDLNIFRSIGGKRKQVTVCRPSTDRHATLRLLVYCNLQPSRMCKKKLTNNVL